MVLNDGKESKVTFFSATTKLGNLVFKKKIGSACLSVWLSPVGGIGIGIEGGCNM